MAALRPPRFDAGADEVARIAAAAPDWATLAAAARPCVACPELAATRQHVVVGDVPEAGHLVLLEKPAEVSDALSALIRRVAADSPAGATGP